MNGEVRQRRSSRRILNRTSVNTVRFSKSEKALYGRKFLNSFNIEFGFSDLSGAHSFKEYI